MSIIRIIKIKIDIVATLVVYLTLCVLNVKRSDTNIRIYENRYKRHTLR